RRGAEILRSGPGVAPLVLVLRGRPLLRARGPARPRLRDGSVGNRDGGGEREASRRGHQTREGTGREGKQTREALYRRGRGALSGRAGDRPKQRFSGR